MDTLVRQAANHRVWAVVGASNNRSKFGNRVYRVLRDSGYIVYPVHPTEQQVEGDPAFPRLQALPETPAVVDVVVPATIGTDIVDDAVESGATYFWLQPGAESTELITKAGRSGLRVIHDRCAMVEKRKWNN